MPLCGLAKGRREPEAKCIQAPSNSFEICLRYSLLNNSPYGSSNDIYPFSRITVFWTSSPLGPVYILLPCSFITDKLRLLPHRAAAHRLHNHANHPSQHFHHCFLSLSRRVSDGGQVAPSIETCG